MFYGTGKTMDKQLYLLAEFDENTQAEIKKIEKIIAENGLSGKQTKNIPYHITLSSYSVDHEEGLKELMDKINIQRIKLTFSSLGLFGLNVLFLNPDMNSKLIDLYNCVKENSINKDDYLAAHVTLLMDEPDNIMKALPRITREFVKISGEIKYISLYEFFPARFIKRMELAV